MKKIKTILLTVFSILLLASCGNNNEKIIKIGVVGPLTGAGATTSDYWMNGFNNAIERLNAESDGETYKLIVEDCQSDPAQTVACYKRLEMQGVKYIVAVGGQFSMAAAPASKGKDVIYFTSADYNETILDVTDRGIRVYPNSKTFADTAVNYLNRTYGFGTFGTFALNSVACLEATKAFLSGVKTIDGSVVFQETYDIGAYDFKNTVSKLSDKKVQAFFMTGFGISPSAFINQLATNSEFDTIVLFGDLNLATKAFVENNKNTKARVNYADVRFDEEQEQSYVERFGHHSNAIVTSAYIIPFLIREARANSPKEDIDAQLRYLRGKTISTQIGEVYIDERGSCAIPMNVYSL